MTNLEFFLSRFEAEYPATLRVFRALPSERLDYRPHAKCRSVGELMQLLVYEEQTGIERCEKGEIHWNELNGVPVLEEMIAAYERLHGRHDDWLPSSTTRSGTARPNSSWAASPYWKKPWRACSGSRCSTAYITGDS
jgi:hypothetical protein